MVNETEFNAVHKNDWSIHLSHQRNEAKEVTGVELVYFSEKSFPCSTLGNNVDVR